MARRKRIGLFVSFPETIHVRRIFDGIRQRCEQYNYDLCVFAAGSHVVFPSEFYIKGETNIYELANFDELDGVILDHQTLTGDENDHTAKRILEPSDFATAYNAVLDAVNNGTLTENRIDESLMRIYSAKLGD